MDDYKHKYLKYKKKYLMLVEEQKKLNNTNNYKIFLGGGIIKVGTQVKTIRNSGSLEKMTNQCFWISILNYLQRHGHETLTLKQLRTNAGLDSTTENIMFDTDIPIFFDAANKIANFYKIQIEVYTVDHEGIVINQRNNIPIDGNSTNIVPIAQFGLQHFELIDEAGNDFIPAIPIDGKLTTTKDIILDDNTSNQLNDEIKENLNKITELTEQLNKFIEEYNNSSTTKGYIEKSSTILNKQKCLDVFNKEIEKTDLTIKNLLNNIRGYENINLSIKYIIESS
jgi:hypothetical protein